MYRSRRWINDEPSLPRSTKGAFTGRDRTVTSISAIGNQVTFVAFRGGAVREFEAIADTDSGSERMVCQDRAAAIIRRRYLAARRISRCAWSRAALA